jgi:hypothetical protein
MSVVCPVREFMAPIHIRVLHVTVAAALGDNAGVVWTLHLYAPVTSQPVMDDGAVRGSHLARPPVLAPLDYAAVLGLLDFDSWQRARLSAIVPGSSHPTAPGRASSGPCRWCGFSGWLGRRLARLRLAGHRRLRSGFRFLRT